jgi:hypothetical protein
MNITNVYGVVTTIIIIILGFLFSYVKGKESITAKISEFITRAELAYKDISKSGGLKRNRVVDWCMDRIPVAVKPFISREMVERLVQMIFDQMEAYAKIQLDKLTDEFIKEKQDTQNNIINEKEAVEV